MPLKKFLSTPSARRATNTFCYLTTTELISIHALREEGDEGQLKMLVGHSKFLSTPSARRATLCRGTFTYTDYLFLSTPSARRATFTI